MARLPGVIKDNAMALVDRVVPAPSALVLDRALAAAMKYVNERGVTSVHDMSMGTWDSLAVFARARKAGTLTVRVYSAAPLADWKRLADIVARREFGGADGRGDEWLRIGALKGFVDGSLGSHTAAFHEPFTDAPADRGLLVNTPEDLYRWISAADSAGLHVVVHACGDRANSALLDIYERVAREHGPRDRRFRIEHAQHLTRADIPRFARLGVIASMQPYHAIDDGRWAERFIGDRITTTYAFRSLLDAKARLAFGSDWFVAPPTPLEGIYAAVTRRTIDDKNPGGWVPEQKITVEEALRAYTVDAAYASFEERLKGHARARPPGRPRRARSEHLRDPARGDSRRARGDDGGGREDGVPRGHGHGAPTAQRAFIVMPSQLRSVTPDAIAASVPLSCGFPQPILLDLVVERDAIDVEDARGVRDVAAALLQDRGDVPALDLLERRRRRGRRGGRRLADAEVAHLQNRAGRAHHRRAPAGCAARARCRARGRPSAWPCASRDTPSTPPPELAPTARSRKCSTSSGMSSRRSRSGGSLIGMHVEPVEEVLAEAALGARPAAGRGWWPR